MEKGKKKIKQNKVNYKTAEQDEIKKFIIVILVVVFCVGAIYFVTRAFVTKDLFKSNEEKIEEVKPGAVNYDVAIMGQLLNRPYDEYYAVIYNKSEGDYISEMTSLVYDYTVKKNHLHMYTIDLSNKLNESYYDKEKINVNAKKLKDLKVGDITLIKVKKGKIDKIIIDYKKMQKELGINS